MRHPDAREAQDRPAMRWRLLCHVEDPQLGRRRGCGCDRLRGKRSLATPSRDACATTNAGLDQEAGTGLANRQTRASMLADLLLAIDWMQKSPRRQTQCWIHAIGVI
jgi:hypothetical protein